MKKTKIMVSIFTFCVAVLALCFGVYAAITINFNVGGTVNYEVNNANVKVTTTLYKSAFKATSDYALKGEADKALTAVPGDWTVAQDLNGDAAGNAHVFNSTVEGWVAGQDDKVTGLAVNYVADEFHSYYVVIEIQNLGVVNAYARITDEVLGEGINSHVYATAGYSQIGKASAKGAEDGGKVTMVIALGLDNKNVGVKDVTFNYVIEMGAGVMPTNLELINDEFWGVKMGYTGNKVPVVWRLVSIDNGVSPYEVNKTVVPAGLGVFVLETNVLTAQANVAAAQTYINAADTMAAINVGTGNAVYKAIKNTTVYNDKYTDDGATIAYENVGEAKTGKFFLLSEAEALNLLADVRTTDVNDYEAATRTGCAWEAAYLIRTVSAADEEQTIGTDGALAAAGAANAVRPAFVLAV